MTVTVRHAQSRKSCRARLSAARRARSGPAHHRPGKASSVRCTPRRRNPAGSRGTSAVAQPSVTPAPGGPHVAVRSRPGPHCQPKGTVWRPPAVAPPGGARWAGSAAVMTTTVARRWPDVRQPAWMGPRSTRISVAPRGGGALRVPGLPTLAFLPRPSCPGVQPPCRTALRPLCMSPVGTGCLRAWVPQGRYVLPGHRRPTGRGTCLEHAEGRHHAR